MAWHLDRHESKNFLLYIRVRRTLVPAVLSAAIALLGMSLFGCTNESTGATTVEAQFDLSEGDDIEFELAMIEARRLEELIQVCMAERGFEYQRQTISAENFGDHEIGGGLDDAEFARQYGFGVAPALLEVTGEIPDESAQTDVDPNQEYLSTLSDQERQRWLESLRGTFEASFGEGENDTEPCWTRAESELGEGDPLVRRVQAELGSIYLSDIPQDVRVVQAEADWVECAKSRGFNFDSRQDMIAEFEREALLASGNSSEISATEPPALVEQAAREIAVAIEMLPCTSQFEETWETVRKEYEAELLAQDPNDLSRDE